MKKFILLLSISSITLFSCLNDNKKIAHTSENEVKRDLISDTITSQIQAVQTKEKILTPFLGDSTLAEPNYFKSIAGDTGGLILNRLDMQIKSTVKVKRHFYKLFFDC